MKCWRIYAPNSNSKVKLTVTSLNMESCDECSCDSIEVFDGSSTSSTSLGKFCAGNVRVVSSSRYLYVKFRADSSRRGNAFTMSYTAVTKGKKRVNMISFFPELLSVEKDQGKSLCTKHAWPM